MEQTLEKPKVKAKAAEPKPSPYVNTNPDFYITEIADDNPVNTLIKRRTIIYSTLDTFIIGPPGFKDVAGNLVYGINTNKSLTIYALNLSIVGDIKIPGGDIKIYCKNLMINNVDTSLNVSQYIQDEYKNADAIKKDFLKYLINNANDGTHGRDGNTIAALVNAELGKKYGKVGLLAGTIEIICASLTLNYKFNLTANGSDGYPGGWAEPGAHGNNGADEVYTIDIHTYCASGGGAGGGGCSSNYTKKSLAPPKAGQFGGKGGTAGFGGKGADGNSITFWYGATKDADMNNLSISNVGGACGMAGNAGEGAESGVRGREVTVSYTNAAVQFGPWGERNKAGVKGDFTEASDNGLDGTCFEKSNFDLREMGAYFDDLFCQKLLQKIKYQYLLNSPTRFLVGGDITYADKPQWDRMKDSLDWFCEMLGDSSKSTSIKKIIYADVTTYQIRANQNKTFFDDPCNYIPRIKFSELVDKFKSSYHSWKEFEVKYFTLAAQFEEKGRESLTNQDMRDHLTISIGVYKEAYGDMLKKVLDQYNVVIDDVVKQKKAMSAVAAFDEKLKKAIKDHFNCKFEDITKGLEMMAFTGVGAAGLLMAGTELATFLNDGFNTIEVGGREEKKQYVINQFTQWESELKDITLKDHLEYKDGSIVEGQQTKMILGNVQKMETEIDNLKESLDASIIEEGKVLINNLKDALFEKGEAILTFNFYIATCNKYKKAWDDAEKSLQDLNNKQQLITPYFTQTVSYYAVLYQDMLEKAMKDLYEMNRKLYYLTYTDALAEIWRTEKKENLWMGAKPVQQNTDTLTKLFNDMKDIESNYFSHQTSAYQYFPNSKKNLDSDVKTIIDDVRLLKTFKQRQDNGHYELTITTVYGKHETYSELYVLNVENSHGLRIDTVQPVIFGARKKLFALNDQVVHHLQSTTVPKEIVQKLDAFHNELYELGLNKKFFNKFKLNEADFAVAITKAIGTKDWEQYKTMILQTASLPTTGDINVLIEHQGNSIVLEKSPTGGMGIPYSFDHNPVECELTHDITITEDNISIDSSGRKNVGLVTDQCLGTVGIYADWILRIKESDREGDNNYGLDLSDVDKIIIFFKGWNHIK